jgi:phage terminase small subunit
MPRTAAAFLDVVPAFRLDIPPPPHLNEAEQAVWRDTVGTADEGHFRPEDRELIAHYCVHVAQARRLMARKRRTPEQMRDLRAETALVMSLSTKLRLGPKSRAPNRRRAESAGAVTDTEPWQVTAPQAPQGPTAGRWTAEGRGQAGTADDEQRASK